MTPLPSRVIASLASGMRADSERWFPALHADPPAPLTVFYALGLAGEVGEVANVIKKAQRGYDDGQQLREGIGAELADCFVYLLLLADECGVDLVAEYEAKVKVNEARWGRATA